GRREAEQRDDQVRAVRAHRALEDLEGVLAVRERGLLVLGRLVERREVALGARAIGCRRAGLLLERRLALVGRARADAIAVVLDRAEVLERRDQPRVVGAVPGLEDRDRAPPGRDALVEPVGGVQDQRLLLEDERDPRVVLAERGLALGERGRDL